MRINKHEYYLGIAENVAKRSTCIRRQYGTVIVKEDKVISTGYNGSPRGCSNCCDTGKCWRTEMGVPSGERYEECLAVHSEANAMYRSSWNDMQGAILYLFGLENGNRIDSKPCKLCELAIRNNGISKVICGNADRTFNIIHIVAD